jgi:hypothetical protein|tara:strand:+ start:698 stop:805 length:108 start_codon:yes stop_codon:yes gene_type:complete
MFLRSKKVFEEAFSDAKLEFKIKKKQIHLGKEIFG